MSHYSDNSASVRVDFFKTDDNGRPRKYAMTEAVIWTGGYRDCLLQEAFIASLIEHLKMPDGGLRGGGLVAVCLEPYHEHSYPIVWNIPERAF